MTKIYAQGNYIVIEANNERKTFQKKGVGFEIVNYDGLYSLNDKGLPMGDFNYSEVKKEDGSGYATPLEFETFLFENTGNFNSGADVSPNVIGSLALGETSSTAYRGDRGKIAYDHSQATGNPHNTTKADIGLGNVNNTSDLDKPISTATQSALNNKADLVGGKVPKAQSQPSTMVMDNSTYVITFTDATGAVQTIDLPLESLFKDANYDAQTKSLIVTLQDGTNRTIPLTDLVDLPEIVLATTNPAVNPTTGQKVYFNTSLGKVWFNVSGAWVFAGNLISDSEKTNLSNAYIHSQTTGNPHGTTKSDIGLGNVDNTSDLNKPISTATQLALNTKANINDIPTKTSFTYDILVSNWTLVSGKYEAVISNVGILPDSFVDVIPSNDHVDIVRSAQIYQSVLISEGSVKVYSKFLPSGTISVTVNIN